MPDTVTPCYRYAHLFFISGVFMLTALLVPVGSQAEETARPLQYDVEVIVFRNRSPRAGGEQWPWQTLDTAGESLNVPVRAGLKTLSGKHHSLDNVAGSLQRSGVYDVLAHTAWRQTAYDRAHAVPYLLNSNKAGYSLHGSIKLIRERFLHLDIDLSLTPSPATPVADTGDASPDPVFHLREKRRLRSGELHYFDHPVYGVIAKVTPYQQAGLPAPEEEVSVEVTDPQITEEGTNPVENKPQEPADSIFQPANQVTY